MSPTTEEPRVLIVEPDPSHRELWRRWLCQAGYATTCTADGWSALKALAAEEHAAVLIELELPGLDGLQLLTILETFRPKLPVILTASSPTLEEVVAALRRSRASDFLVKPVVDHRALLRALDLALGTSEPPTAPATRWLTPPPKPGCPPAPNKPVPPHVEPLSERERTLIELLAEGMDTRDIAARMRYREKTVRNYLSRIYEKLDVPSRLAAVAFCREHGLLSQHAI